MEEDILGAAKRLHDAGWPLETVDETKGLAAAAGAEELPFSDAGVPLFDALCWSDAEGSSFSACSGAADCGGGFVFLTKKGCVLAVAAEPVL